MEKKGGPKQKKKKKDYKGIDNHVVGPGGVTKEGVQFRKVPYAPR